MEYLRNGSLDSFVQRKVFFNPDEAAWDPQILHRIVLGVCRGMAHLASQGVVHRDLAARNVLLGGHCEPKISDFGMSRMVGQDKQTGQTNSTVGPIKWMPPESLSERIYSEKSDVWAYGVTLYELTTGREPFDGDDFLRIVLEVRDSGRTVLTDMDEKERNKIPKYILRVMEACFATNPDDRPSFAEIEKLLAKGTPAGYREIKEDEQDEPDDIGKANASSGVGKYGDMGDDNGTNRTNKGKEKNKSNKSNKTSTNKSSASKTSTNDTQSSNKTQQQSETREQPEPAAPARFDSVVGQQAGRMASEYGAFASQSVEMDVMSAPPSEVVPPQSSRSPRASTPPSDGEAPPTSYGSINV
jgi:serine/threonine protein kinase